MICVEPRLPPLFRQRSYGVLLRLGNGRRWLRGSANSRPDSVSISGLTVKLSSSCPQRFNACGAHRTVRPPFNAASFVAGTPLGQGGARRTTSITSASVGSLFISRTVRSQQSVSARTHTAGVAVQVKTQARTHSVRFAAIATMSCTLWTSSGLGVPASAATSARLSAFREPSRTAAVDASGGGPLATRIPFPLVRRFSS
jgi:hypothetical protein